MGTPWDRAAQTYLEEWVPRFVPYHIDLVRELALNPGQRALVASAGAGAEVIAVARAVGDIGTVLATDSDASLIALCATQSEKAGFKNVLCAHKPPSEVGPGNWHAIICAFGLWKMPDRVSVLKAWAGAIVPNGKIGVLTFGPPEEGDPFQTLKQALHELEPNAMTTPSGIAADRESMTRMFEEAGLSLVRHTVLRHRLTFATAEDFTKAICAGRTWGRVWEELGPERMGLVTARFYDQMGGPTAPLSFEPTVTLAIAALPGAEVELMSRPSVTAPPLSQAPKP